VPRARPDSEARKEHAIRRLETRNAVCACGESDPRCLDKHHIASRKHHGDTAFVCCNCHRKLSDQQLDHPRDELGQDANLAAIGHYLLGLANLMAMQSEAFVRFGTWLIEHANKQGEK